MQRYSQKLYNVLKGKKLSKATLEKKSEIQGYKNFNQVATPAKNQQFQLAVAEIPTNTNRMKGHKQKPTKQMTFTNLAPWAQKTSNSNVNVFGVEPASPMFENALREEDEVLSSEEDKTQNLSDTLRIKQLKQ